MKNLFYSLILLLLSSYAFSQVGINTTTPSAASVLDIESAIAPNVHGGFLIPRVSVAQRDLIPTVAADDGMMVYLQNGTNRCLQIWDGFTLQWENVYCMPVNQAPVANSVTFTGIYQVGETLTASFLYSDAENDPQGAHNYNWYSAITSGGIGQALIQSGTSGTYVLTNTELTKFISVEVTPLATAGTSPGIPVQSAYDGPITPPIVNASDLFISEYVEGNSQNKILEFANFTGSPLNLLGYKVRGYNNGSTTANPIVYSFPAVTLANGDVFVVARSEFTANPAVVDDNFAWIFNGDDAVVLFGPTNNRVDVVGEVGNGTLFAEDVTLRKKPAIGPNTTYTPSDYIRIDPFVFDGLGSHTY